MLVARAGQNNRKRTWSRELPVLTHNRQKASRNVYVQMKGKMSTKKKTEMDQNAGNWSRARRGQWMPSLRFS